MAQLFASYLTGYSEALSTMSTRNAEAGMDGLLHLLFGLANSVSERVGDDGEKLPSSAVLALADRHIAMLLSDPAFDVGMLARVLGMSRSCLYRAFVERGGVAAAIRDACLDRARSRLTAPVNRHQTLVEVAFTCGFTDYVNFTRAFRQRFGMSPKDARA